MLVVAGLLRLPGASGFETPSTRRTTITSNVEHMPKIEVYESKARGQKTEGMRLETRISNKQKNGNPEMPTHIASPIILYVSEEYVGITECNESPKRVTSTTLSKRSVSVLKPKVEVSDVPNSEQLETKKRRSNEPRPWSKSLVPNIRIGAYLRILCHNPS